MNWDALGRETVELLRQYLMLDTTNPPGNETAGARFLEEVLRRDDIASETVESAPGRGNLVARLRGDGSEGGIVLHHHIDVVYADRRYWTVDPFGGVIQDGFLFGRGALDMKSTGVLHLAGMLAIKRAGVRLKRDLILLATADEEAGSRFGAQWVADQRRQWLSGAEYALSELGGIYPEGGPAGGHRAPFASIVTSEKTGLPLRLTARSQPGHGSMPWPDTAPNHLIRALGRLLEAERPLRVLPEVQEYFERLGSVMPGAAGKGYDDLARSLGDPTFRRAFLADRHQAAMLRTTFAVTVLRGSEKRTVIPPEASAYIDCRMLRGDDPEEIVAWVRGVVADPRVEVSLINPPPKIPNASPPDTPLYKALGEALRRRAPGAVVAPDILVGFTDNWVFRNCGLHGYGFSPFILEESEWRRVHGNDERISLENLQEGVRCHTELLLEMAAA
jgi:acetylornithine deacetylase/succinyl-diaminopimelate desuccinylase-like protein